MTLNKKIVDLVPYEPISGTYKIRLDANECPTDLPEDIKSELKAAVDKVSFNRYPDPLAQGVTEAFAKFYGIKPELVTAGNGSDELIFLIESAFLEKFYSSICEVECGTFTKNDSLDIDVDALIAKINADNIKLLIFSNPCNPTGRGITAEQARKLVNGVNALVVLDEAYMDFWNQSLIGEVDNYSNLIIFRTASKAIGSAALRLGFAVANTTISSAIKAVKSPYNVNSFSQAAGEIIYNHPDFLKNRLKTIVLSREKLYNGLVKISAENPSFAPVESVANFVFVKTPDSKRIWEYLKEKSIVVRLMGEYLRITAGTDEEVSETLAAINQYFMEA